MLKLIYQAKDHATRKKRMWFDVGDTQYSLQGNRKVIHSFLRI